MPMNWYVPHHPLPCRRDSGVVLVDDVMTCAHLHFLITPSLLSSLALSLLYFLCLELMACSHRILLLLGFFLPPPPPTTTSTVTTLSNFIQKQ